MNYFPEIIVKNNLFMYHIDVAMGFISFRNLNFSEALSKERGSSSGGCAAGVLGNAPTVVAIAAAAFAVVTDMTEACSAIEIFQSRAVSLLLCGVRSKDRITGSFRESSEKQRPNVEAMPWLHAFVALAARSRVLFLLASSSILSDGDRGGNRHPIPVLKIFVAFDEISAASRRQRARKRS